MLRCGIDIGGTNTQIGLVDEKGRVIDHDKIQTGIYAEAPDFVVTIAYCILRMCKVGGFTTADLKGIGVGCPNVNPSTGIVAGSANLPFKGDVNLKREFARYFPDTPLYFDNDANAAALGEKVFGKAQNMDDYIFITLGTGVGSGIVSGGRLLYGLNGMAGEAGHMIVEPQGRPCGCGRQGCLEQYAGAGGIFHTYEQLCKQENKAPKADSYRAMADLARAGDETALKTYEETGRILGRALANLACITAPSHIFIFGGVAKVGEILLEPVRRHFNQNLLFCYKDQIEVELSGLMDKENDAAMLGAASLCP